ncbi:hypothetical protein ACJJTC_013752 [Scirpophaga incertulas]
MPKRSAPEKLERYERKIRKIQQQEESKPLGASTSESPDFGDAAHESLATLWHPILRKGLPKEEKEKLTKESLIPVNCKLLQSPTLNPEIAAAVSEIVKSDNKSRALKQLSNSCRLLTDLHFSFTKDRSNAASQPSTSRTAQQGNWTGPPRYPSIRGGGGGQQRPASRVNRRSYPSTSSQIAPKNFSHPKTRANVQH